MNKRQAKKKFKKQYGMNPEEAAVVFEKGIQELMDNMPGIMDQIREQVQQITKAAVETVNEAMKEFREIVKDMNDVIPQITEALNEYAEMMRFEEILKNAHILPDGVDTGLLEDLGEKRDSLWNTYHLYRDKANDCYFVEFEEEHNE